MSIHRETFEVVAAAFRPLFAAANDPACSTDLDTVCDAVNAIADEFSEHNNRFDRERFLRAAGYPLDTVEN